MAPKSREVSVVPLPDQAKVDAYLAWLRAEGAELNGVGVASFPDTARGVVALRDIEPGEVVVSIPDHLAFLCDSGCAESALRSWNLSNDASKIVPPHMQREALAIAVAAELLAGESSRWGPYFVRRSLPRLLQMILLHFESGMLRPAIVSLAGQ